MRLGQVLHNSFKRYLSVHQDVYGQKEAVCADQDEGEGDHDLGAPPELGPLPRLP